MTPLLPGNSLHKPFRLSAKKDATVVGSSLTSRTLFNAVDGAESWRNRELDAFLIARKNSSKLMSTRSAKAGLPRA
jgi:hypothetical protein